MISILIFFGILHIPVARIKVKNLLVVHEIGHPGAGNGCGSFSNRLEVIDISDIAHPVLKRSYIMENPYGLAVQDSLLFVCDGDTGLKLMDNANNPLNMFVRATYSGVRAYDVIPFASSLLMIGDDGLFQYEVESRSELKLLSSIPVKKP